ncbi:MAG TPA: DUF937 domain-containing protein [Thermoflexales bacterium]|nr:DUF937 domain-containing protein [Thermoflexales bacterium]HQW34495.1 DUF937 domain-containing protein [Thermoflexales bacterium]HQZ22395.1 DUF937 domain-containing protein [Thermoflexales bacterium]HQZ98766.1 DUF937 domain-containing protein [Thermoflexales bacterium]
MSSPLINGLLQQFSPQIVSAISQKLGVSPAIVQTGLSFVLPMLTGTAARNMSSPTDASNVLGMLKGADMGQMGNLAGLVGGLGGNQQNPLAGLAVNALMGNDQASRVSSAINQATGTNIGGSLLSMAAPAVLSAISGQATQGKLDGAGVANMMKSQSAGMFGDNGADMMGAVTKSLGVSNDSALQMANGVIGKLFG